MSIEAIASLIGFIVLAALWVALPTRSPRNHTVVEAQQAELQQNTASAPVTQEV